MTRQRASCSATTWAMQSRISWSSAPRLAGFEILIRVTPGAGSSRRTFPEASVSVEDNERVSLRHGLTFLALDCGDRAVVLRLDGHLHLHRLEDHERVALRDLIADLALDLPHGPGDVGLDVGHVCSPRERLRSRGNIGAPPDGPGTLDRRGGRRPPCFSPRGGAPPPPPPPPIGERYAGG